MRNGPPAAAKDFDVGRAAFAQEIDNFPEALNVAAIVTGNADGPHIFLDSSTYNVANRAMITEINDLNPVPDKLEIDRVDRAVVPVANRDGSKNANRRGPQAKSLTVTI